MNEGELPLAPSCEANEQCRNEVNEDKVGVAPPCIEPIPKAHVLELATLGSEKKVVKREEHDEVRSKIGGLRHPGSLGCRCQ